MSKDHSVELLWQAKTVSIVAIVTYCICHHHCLDGIVLLLLSLLQQTILLHLLGNPTAFLNYFISYLRGWMQFEARSAALPKHH